MNLWTYRWLYWLGAWATGFVIGFSCACGMPISEGVCLFILSLTLLTLVFYRAWKIERGNEKNK